MSVTAGSGSRSSREERRCGGSGPRDRAVSRMVRKPEGEAGLGEVCRLRSRVWAIAVMIAVATVMAQKVTASVVEATGSMEAWL